jgi:hypothetical protein
MGIPAAEEPVGAVGAPDSALQTAPGYEDHLLPW